MIPGTILVTGRQVLDIGLLLFLVAAGGAGLLLYVLPSALALGRNHPQKIAIVAVNVLVGWTFLGWVVAFVWAVTAFRREDERSFYGRR